MAYKQSGRNPPVPWTRADVTAAAMMNIIPSLFPPILLSPDRHLWLDNHALIPWVAGKSLQLAFSVSI